MLGLGWDMMEGSTAAWQCRLRPETCPASAARGPLGRRFAARTLGWAFACPVPTSHGAIPVPLTLQWQLRGHTLKHLCPPRSSACPPASEPPDLLLGSWKTLAQPSRAVSVCPMPPSARPGADIPQSQACIGLRALCAVTQASPLQ